MSIFSFLNSHHAFRCVCCIFLVQGEKNNRIKLILNENCGVKITLIQGRKLKSSVARLQAWVTFLVPLKDPFCPLFTRCLAYIWINTQCKIMASSNKCSTPYPRAQKDKHKKQNIPYVTNWVNFLLFIITFCICIGQCISWTIISYYSVNKGSNI